MNIDKLNPAQMQFLAERGYAQPGRSFANCTGIVYGLEQGDYVLCWMTDQAGSKHGHAVVQIGGTYYDPTLQNANQTAAGYEWVRTMTRHELTVFMIAHGAALADGKLNGWPPSLLADGTIQCVDFR